MNNNVFFSVIIIIIFNENLFYQNKEGKNKCLRKISIMKIRKNSS